MSAKKKKDVDLDLDDELNDESVESAPVEEESSESESDEPIDVVDDDETFHDDIIEVDDEDLEFELKTEAPADDVVLSKHTIQGKHSLKYDSIFKGKKEDPLTEDSVDVNNS